jgi:hypothetical protein
MMRGISVRLPAEASEAIVPSVNLNLSYVAKKRVRAGSGLDAFEQGRDRNLKSRQHGLIFEDLVLLESFRLAGRVEGPYHTLFREEHPDRLAALSKIQFDLAFQNRGLLRRDDLNRYIWRTTNQARGPGEYVARNHEA